MRKPHGDVRLTSALAALALFLAGTSSVPAADGDAAKPQPRASKLSPPKAEARPLPREKAPEPKDAISLTGTTLNGHWFGYGPEIAEKGLSIALYFTEVYQTDTLGGLSTSTRRGRNSGNIELQLGLDLEKTLKLKGATVYCYAKSSWTSARGINARAVGSLSNVNNNADGGYSIIVEKLYWEQKLLSNHLALNVGKQDPTAGWYLRGQPVGFDQSTYANSDSLQFLNGAFNNNLAAPFPSDGLGLNTILHSDGFYVCGLATDARARETTSGFDTLFGGHTRVFVGAEVGCVPVFETAMGKLPGAYRVGVTYDPSEYPELDGSGAKSGRTSFYLNFDQALYRENKKDDQGLGVSLRFSVGNPETLAVKQFYALAAQYDGLIPSRDKDRLGVGVALLDLSRDARQGNWYEMPIEAYYSIAITPRIGLATDFQYIVNPGGDSDLRDAVVVALRLHVAF